MSDILGGHIIHVREEEVDGQQTLNEYHFGGALSEAGSIDFSNDATTVITGDNVQDALEELDEDVEQLNETVAGLSVAVEADGDDPLPYPAESLTQNLVELNTKVGAASSASAVSGTDAFSKINTLNSNKLNLASAFFGDISKFAKTSFTDIDAYFNGLDTSESLRTFKNNGVIYIDSKHMGSTQFGIGWITSDKQYAWCMLMSINGFLYGKKSAGNNFVWTKIVN